MLRTWPEPPLVLRHASKGVSGSWADDDYDVMTGESAVSRIRSTAPNDKTWRVGCYRCRCGACRTVAWFAPTLAEARPRLPGTGGITTGTNLTQRLLMLISA
jgi:hypothetical protein